MTGLDRNLTNALERAPQVAVPAGFAARVAAAVPAQRPQLEPTRRPHGTHRTQHEGRYSFLAGVVVLLLAMLCLAPWAMTHSLVSLTVELSLALGFCVLIVYQALRPASLR